MALHDLTPQLRTRLSRLERTVGWFVIIAVAALTFGFGYYIYTTAERKGWFKVKAVYFTFARTATGLRVGDPVQLMGFDVGRITRITSQPPYDQYNVYVEFEVQAPFYGYLWTQGSLARIAPADLLGKRVLEVTKGTNGYPSYNFYPMQEFSAAEARDLHNSTNWVYAQEILRPGSGDVVLAAPFGRLTNIHEVIASGVTSVLVMNPHEERKLMTGIWNQQARRYLPYVRGGSKYWLDSDEAPAVTDRLTEVIAQVQGAIPGVLSLTNQVSAVLSNVIALSTKVTGAVETAQPLLTNLTSLTGKMDHPGGIGELLIPTDLNTTLTDTLATGKVTLDTANTNMAVIASELTKSLENLASITSNLNNQVQVSSNLVPALNQTIVDADSFLQGLKRHWLLRSAFREQKPAQPKRQSKPAEKLPSPKDPARSSER